jgi:hypothetical protein
MRTNPCQRNCVFTPENLCLGCDHTMFDITELERDRGPLDINKPSKEENVLLTTLHRFALLKNKGTKNES